MNSDRANFDSQMMGIAIRMAKRGVGTTAPNPSVGAVIADEATGEVIARGWTQPGGRPHAEKEALARAGDRARGRTMYVTLEPCAHTGRVPTCADAMLTAGLRRVVCAIPDPNPVVSGRGFAQLRAQGVEVDVGLRADDARWVTLGHILRQTANRPFVQLKMALDAGGRIAAGDGAPVWVTGTEARAYAHLLRAEADAILVGSGTVLADDPELTCRLPGLGARSPDRIVLDTRLRTPASAKVYRQNSTKERVLPGAPVAHEQPRILPRAPVAHEQPRVLPRAPVAHEQPRVLPRAPVAHEQPRVWIAAAIGEAERDASAHCQGGALVFDVGSRDGRALDLDGLLDTLAVNGITRLMVEGGPTVWHAFLVAGFVDEVCVVTAPTRANGATIAVIEGDHDAFFARFNLHPALSRGLGADRLAIYRRESP